MNIPRMTKRYRRFSWLSDIRGIRSTIAELRGYGHPAQPRLDRALFNAGGDPTIDEQWFVETIKGKVLNSAEGTMEFPFLGERIFEEPLVGFVRGDDPLLPRFKEIIGPHHFTPHEMISWQAAKNNVPAPREHEISVVSFILPIAEPARRDNAVSKLWPAERWAQTRLIGEIFSQFIVRGIVTDLMARGILAISPDVTSMFNKKRYPRVGWASPWSHRHYAYAAGLGTFGMHDFLITPAGAGHRCASFVVARKLKPDRERPADIHAGCLQFQGKDCLACAKRCPVGAISDKGHDKELCYQHVKKSVKYCNSNYHIFIYGCGLCSTGVPCESQDPASKKTGRG